MTTVNVPWFYQKIEAPVGGTRNVQTRPAGPSVQDLPSEGERAWNPAPGANLHHWTVQSVVCMGLCMIESLKCNIESSNMVRFYWLHSIYCRCSETFGRKQWHTGRHHECDCQDPSIQMLVTVMWWHREKLQPQGHHPWLAGKRKDKTKILAVKALALEIDSRFQSLNKFPLNGFRGEKRPACRATPKRLP